MKVSSWKRVVRFGKKGKLAPRYVGPFEIIERVGPVAYRLKLLHELSYVHDTFHVSNLKKCLAEPDVQVPLDEIEIDENLRFVEEPIEIVERDVKKLNKEESHWSKYVGTLGKEMSILRNVVEDFGVPARPFDSHEDDTPDVLKSRPEQRYFYYYANEEGNSLMGGLEIFFMHRSSHVRTTLWRVDLNREEVICIMADQDEFARKDVTLTTSQLPPPHCKFEKLQMMRGSLEEIENLLATQQSEDCFHTLAFIMKANNACRNISDDIKSQFGQQGLSVMMVPFLLEQQNHGELDAWFTDVHWSLN
ncbi:hypothetical protein Tco_0525531 [Tanacetum coccineum]